MENNQIKQTPTSGGSPLNDRLCVVCKLPLGDSGSSPYAAFGGLPSPCCEHCFEANDSYCKTTDDVMIKSVARRNRLGVFPFNSIVDNDDIWLQKYTKQQYFNSIVENRKIAIKTPTNTIANEAHPQVCGYELNNGLSSVWK